jgi:putative membrane protein
MRVLLTWAINAGVLLLLPYMVSAVHIQDFLTALIVAVVLGLLNAIVRPILVLLTLPVTLLTLGLFLLVINGLMFWFAARILDGFSVDGFGWAVLAALLYSAISTVVSTLLLRRDA